MMPQEESQPTPRPSMQIPVSGVDQPRLGSLFTVALLKAGRNNCNCESCLILKRIVDEMEKQLGIEPGAGPG